MKIKSILTYILVFFTIFEGGDVKFYLNDNLFLILMLIFAGYFFMMVLMKRKQDNTIIKYALVLIILIILNLLLNDFSLNSISTYIGQIIRIFIALIIATIISYDEFSDKFIKLIVLICITSLAFYMIGYLNNNFRYIFPVIQKDSGSRFGNAILYSYNLDPNILSVTRNSSIFNEPGKFQIFISIALFFELAKNQFKNKKRLILFIITMLTTGSSTGLICLILIFSGKIFEGKKIKSIYKGLILTALIALIFSSQFQTDILTKFNEDNTSYARRNTDYLIDLQIMKTNPILGVGIEKYNLLFNDMVRFQTLKNYGNTVQSSSNSLTAGLALYGLVFVTLILWGIYRFLKRYYYGRGLALTLSFCIFLIICASQNVLMTILILLISIYGFKKSTHTNINFILRKEEIN